MPPRLSLRPLGHRRPLFLKAQSSECNSVCFFCSLSVQFNAESRRRPRRRSQNPRRLLSSASAAASLTASADPVVVADPRRELESVLLELQKHAANYVNLSRLQLALNSLRQPPGHESIRVAVLGLSDGPESGRTAKQVLKLLLADPLKAEEDWEKEIEGYDLTRPVIVRVGPDLPQELGSVSILKESPLREVNVSSATLNEHNLELLLAEIDPPVPVRGSTTLSRLEDSVLVPTVEIPTSSTGRHTPITTPVHKALVVAEGILGAASVVPATALESRNVVAAAVNLPDYKPTDATPLPFTPIDIGTANVGLGLVRNNLGDAIKFEHLWFQSNLPQLVEWLKADTVTSPDNTTKLPVRALIGSLLRNASAAIRDEAARRAGSSLSATSSASLKTLQASLDDWAEGAHTELQEQLDLAFSSKRWRTLSWWKLFWRVDDVGMITNDILSQRFLPASERSAIFLAGRMRESGVAIGPFPNPSDSEGPSRPSSGQDSASTLSDAKSAPSPPAVPWPVNIPATRRYLQTETIPALQALAQKLVMQNLSTSGLTTALGVLVYCGTLTTTLYEAGAVAALGIVWSMRRMQERWEAARGFWEDEVREEGRKAVRGVEGVVGQALSSSSSPGRATDRVDDGGEGRVELDRAKGLVERAQEILGRLK
ncbi:hypothetical protein GGS23DRAFT_547351 [Durotheca rogersii]|uniref:uncharacterized protein n=1 Tax=Durotheca rogersii TaxID=419775 RepID=UPI00221FA3E3|nr:uncharacterized protein GGS23DRAFT_547351 [Durotheca rogersii]KAI5867215.1 hypothetical protein GGS23DRAFT_547351 [Durotheca rogersii]